MRALQLHNKAQQGDFSRDATPSIMHEVVIRLCVSPRCSASISSRSVTKSGKAACIAHEIGKAKQAPQSTCANALRSS